MRAPSPPPAPARRALVVALAVLVLAGCAKDLELPPLSTAPVLSSLTPPRAWAGQLVTLGGTGLDPEPSANVVTFAGATARGVRFEGGALVVRVPDDAGSGPVIVTNGRGTSVPFGALEYLGLGEPRRRAVSTSRSILHRPAAVHAVGGDVFVHSSLYGGLLKAGAGTFSSPPAALTAAAPWKGALYTVEQAGRDAQLTRIDAASGAASAPLSLPFAPTQLLAMRVPNVIVAITSAGPQLAAWDLETLGTVIAPTALPVADFSAAADLGDGRAVVFGLDDAFDFRLFLVDIGATPTLGPIPPPAVADGALGFAEIPATPGLAVAFSDRWDASGISTGEPLAAVSLASGDLAVARLGAAGPAFLGTIETFSPSAVAALAGAATLPVVLATKPDDDLSIGVDLVSQQVLWSVPGSAPGPASATGDVALVANAADDDVSVVNLATGFKIARVSFDVRPGAPGAATFGAALALLPRDPTSDSSEDALYVPADGFPALLELPLGGGAARCVLRGAGIGPVAASSAPGVWAARSGAPSAVETLPGRPPAAGVPVPLPGVTAPGWLVAGGPGVLVGHDAGFSLLAGGSALAGTAAIPGATALHGLGFAPDGRIWAVPQVGDDAVAQLWDPSQIGTGGAPARATALPDGLSSSAAWLEDGLWVLGAGRPAAATLLGPDLAIARTVPLTSGTPAIAAVSPNGRLLVERTIGGPAGETLLRFYRADPDAGFPLIDQIVIEGNVEGLTFDGSGERLWIVTRSPDRVVLVD